MMEYFVSAIWIGIELLCVIFFNGAFLDRKKRIKFLPFIIVLLWGALFTYTYLPLKPFIQKLVAPVVLTVISMFLYKGSNIAHFCLAAVCYIFIISFDVIAVNGMCSLLGISYDVLVLRKLSYGTIITADKLLVMLFAWLLYRFRKKGNPGKLQGKWLLLSVLFPIVSVLMFLLFFYYTPEGEDISVSSVIFSCMLMAANIAMLYVIDNIEKVTAQEQNVRLLKQQISLQAENYNALKENYSVQRKAAHEFERHIQALRDLLDREEYASARNYVHELLANRSLKNFCINSKNPIIDVVLNQKYQLAQENRIAMRVKVNDLSCIPYHTDELVVLLSNLLDNAIEACMKIDGKREIVCSILAEDDLYISIRNTSNPTDIINGEIATSKPETAEHGFGIPAVKFVLEHFGAEYTFSYKDGWFQFVSEIPM